MVNNQSIKDLEDSFGPIQTETAVIYNGVDINRFNSATKAKHRLEMRNFLNIDTDDFVFVYCGRIVREKGIDKIISSFLDLAKRCSNIKLLIIGSAKQDNFSDFAYEAELHEMIPAQLSDKIIFTGFIQRDQLPMVYSAADCGILATDSKTSEGLPSFLLECLSQGTPIIAPALGGIPEVVRNNRDGIIISKEFPVNEMVEAMESMVINNESWAEKSSQTAQYFQQHFCFRRVAEEFVQVIKDIRER